MTATHVSEVVGPDPTTPLVEMRNVHKAFAGIVALDGVHLSIARGGVHAIVGENGAGKSTLMRVLAGAHQADSGEILIDGKPVELHNPIDAVRAGIATIYQELLLCPNLSAAANVFLGEEITSGLGFLRDSEMQRQAEAHLALLGLNIDVRAPISTLPIAQRQLIEIARGVRREGRVLILDEPTSALSEPEIRQLFRVINVLRDHGKSVVYISHRLEEIFEIADYVTVMRDGLVVENVTTAEATEATLIRAMVGRDVTITQIKDRFELAGELPLLEVKDLTTDSGVGNVSFVVHPGEVLGIAGIVGAGRTELLRAIFGLDHIKYGEVRVHGHAIVAGSPRTAIKAGIAFATEDRKRDGIFPNFRVREHLSISSLSTVSRFNWINRRAERRLAVDLSKSMNIQPNNPEAMILALSGGNQQKVTIGRCLLTDPRILLLDEPTRGVDVGAKAEIRRLIREFADRGRAVVMVSSEIPELLATVDRILVMKDGHVVAELITADTDQEEIMTHAAGETATEPIERRS